MKIIQVKKFGDPGTMALEDVPMLRPGPREILVRVKAAGVNPVDTYIRSGTYATKPDLPYTPGFDAGGIVEAAGPKVKGFRKGARVYCSGSLTGTYAEFTLCKSTQVHLIPNHINFSQAAGVYVPYATAYRALFQKAHAKKGNILLVHGASGGVGIASVQFGRALGMYVIGTASTDRGKALVKESGAQYILDHHHPAYLEEIMKITGGKGVDIILEMLANVNLNNDLTLLARGGRVVVIGSRGKIEIDPRLAMSKDGVILGMSLMNVLDKDLAAIHAVIVRGLKNGTLKPVVGKEIPLKDAAQAHIEIMKPGSYGKIVLIP